MPDFNPQTAFGPEVFSWAIGKNHPWYDKTLQEIEAMGAKRLMYFRNQMDHNTYIYQDPFGQLIQANVRWNKAAFVLDWNRFLQNHILHCEKPDSVFYFFRTIHGCCFS